MANADAPRGLRPVRMLDGSPWNGAVQRCSIGSAVADDLFIGSPVKLDGTGDTYTGYGTANSGGSYPGVDLSEAAEVIFGVIVAFDPDRGDLTSLGSLVHDASAWAVDRQCLVAVASPTTVFEVQASTTTGVAVAGAFWDDTTESADPTAVSVSNVEIVAGTAAKYRLIGPVNRPDNDPSLTNADWEVVAVLTQVGPSALTLAV